MVGTQQTWFKRSATGSSGYDLGIQGLRFTVYGLQFTDAVTRSTLSPGKLICHVSQAKACTVKVERQILGQVWNPRAIIHGELGMDATLQRSGGLPPTRWLAATLEVEECTKGNVVGLTMSHAVDQRPGN